MRYLYKLLTIVTTIIFLSGNLSVIDGYALTPWYVSQIPVLKSDIMDVLAKKHNIEIASGEEDTRLLEENFTDVLLLKDTGKKTHDTGKFIVSPECYSDGEKLTRGMIRACFTAYLQGVYISDPYKFFSIKDIVLSIPRIDKIYRDAFHSERTEAFNEDFLVIDATARAMEALYSVNYNIIDDPEEKATADFTAEEKVFYKKLFSVVQDPINRERVFNKGLYVTKEDFSVLHDRLRSFLSRHFLNTGFAQVIGDDSFRGHVVKRKGVIENLKEKLDREGISDSNFAELLDVKTLSPESIELLKTRIIEYSRTEELGNSGILIDDAIRVAHLLYLNPSMHAREICERLGLDKNDKNRLRDIFKIIRENPVFHYIFLNISCHSKYFDTIMFLYNNPEYVDDVINGRTMVTPEMDFHLSYKECSRQCIHCFNQLKKNRYSDPEYPGRKLDIKTVERTLREFARLGGKMINFSGGTESSDYENLPVIMRMAKENRLKYQMYTNALNISEELIEELMGAERVRVSIDAATGSTYAVISGFKDSKGYFKNVIENLKTLIKRKEETGSNVDIGIQFVAQPGNYHEIPSFIELGVRLGVDFINISYDYLERDGIALNGEQISRIENMVKEVDIKKQNGELGHCRIVFAEKFTQRYRGRKYSEKLRNANNCEAHNYKMAIDPKGNVHYCCFYAQPDFLNKDFIMGNINWDELTDIVGKARVKKVNPDICPNCHDFDRYINLFFDKLNDDIDFGIEIKAQPFISLLEYYDMAYSGKSTPLEALRAIFSKLGEREFDLSKILRSGISVTRRNLKDLLRLGLIVPAEDPGFFRISDMLREKGIDPAEMEENFASIYNAVLFPEKDNRALFSLDISEGMSLPDKDIVNADIMKERIKMELMHKKMRQLIEADDKGDRKMIRIWSGYLSDAQKRMITLIQKKSRNSSKGFRIEFEDDLDILADSACGNLENTNIVTILPYALLSGDKKRNIRQNMPQVLFMEMKNNDDILDAFTFLQLEGILAAGAAYLNGDNRAFAYIYNMLTGRNTEITLEDVKKDPKMLIFYLAPVVIYSTTSEYRDMVYTMTKMLSSA